LEAIYFAFLFLFFSALLWIFLASHRQDSRPEICIGVAVVSVIAWLVCFGSFVPRYTAGFEERAEAPSTFLDCPWLVHQVYIRLFKGISAGGADAVICAGIFLLSILLPVLAVHVIRRIYAERSNAAQRFR
jgi:hypothetical protein